MAKGVGTFLRDHLPGIGNQLGDTAYAEEIEALRAEAQRLLAAPVPPRPPSFCTGCPERPIFAATKLVEQDLGPHHIAGDIGCHLFSIFPPFEIGGSTMGYGLGPASTSALQAPAASCSACLAPADNGARPSPVCRTIPVALMIP